MSNLIQIKRSLNTAVPTNLSAGELAYSANGEQLFIGSPNGNTVTAIGGEKFSFVQQANTSNDEGGKLSANAVIITDANSFVNEIRTSNLVINTSGNTSLSINGIITSGSLSGASNTTIPTAWAVKDYVDNNSAAKFKDLDDVNVTGISNNDVVVFNASSNTFEDRAVSGTANEVDVTFTNTSITIGLPDSVEVANTFKAGSNALFVNSSSVSVKDNLILNGTVEGSIVPSQDGVYNLGNSSVGFNTLYVNTINGSIVSETLTGNTLSVSGNTDLGTALSDLINIVGAINTTLTPNGNGAVSFGSATNYWSNGYIRNVFSNNASIANLDVTTINRDPTITVTLSGDITGNASATLTNLANGSISITTEIAANSVALGTDTTGDYVANLTSGAGISITSGTGEGSTPTIAVVGNTGVTVNSHGVFIGQAVGTTDNVTFANVVATTASIASNNLFVNTSAVYVNSNLYVVSDILPTTNNAVDLGSDSMRFKDIYLAGNTIQLGNTTISDDNGSLSVNSANITATLTIGGNTTIGSNTQDIVTFNAQLASSIVPSTNVAYDLGSSSLQFANVYSNNVLAYGATIGLGGLTVDGDLTVTGNLTSIDVTQLVVQDPLIHLASNNGVSDTLDIGFIGHYSTDNGVTERHTGIFRDATDGRYFLFDNYVDANLDAGSNSVNIIDVSNNTFRVASLVTYLESGALVSNGTNLSITASNTINVGITANTLSLTTALEVEYGGTGLQSVTNNAILFGSGTGALQEASGSNGQILQITNNVPTFGSLDGGSF